MERLGRFDVARYADVLMVIVESELLPPDPSVVVIPLLQGYPPVARLNPTISFEGKAYILATRLITSTPRSRLKRVGDIAKQADQVVHALDVLIGGV